MATIDITPTFTFAPFKAGSDKESNYDVFTVDADAIRKAIYAEAVEVRANATKPEDIEKGYSSAVSLTASVAITITDERITRFFKDTWGRDLKLFTPQSSYGITDKDGVFHVSVYNSVSVSLRGIKTTDLDKRVAKVEAALVELDTPENRAALVETLVEDIIAGLTEKAETITKKATDEAVAHWGRPSAWDYDEDDAEIADASAEIDALEAQIKALQEKKAAAEERRLAKHKANVIKQIDGCRDTYLSDLPGAADRMIEGVESFKPSKGIFIPA